jgi:ribosomal protein L7/L12
VKPAARWRPRSHRQIWVIIPRPVLLCSNIGLVAAGWIATETRRSRLEREALATRLATLSRDDIPAHVIDLLLAGRKIEAINCYREQAGTSLRDAKDLIDSL